MLHACCLPLLKLVALIGSATLFPLQRIDFTPQCLTSAFQESSILKCQKNSRWYYIFMRLLSALKNKLKINPIFLKSLLHVCHEQALQNWQGYLHLLLKKPLPLFCELPTPNFWQNFTFLISCYNEARFTRSPGKFPIRENLGGLL